MTETKESFDECCNYSALFLKLSVPNVKPHSLLGQRSNHPSKEVYKWRWNSEYFPTLIWLSLIQPTHQDVVKNNENADLNFIFIKLWPFVALLEIKYSEAMLIKLIIDETIVLFIAWGTGCMVGPVSASRQTAKTTCKQDIWTERAVINSYIINIKLWKIAYLVREPAYRRFWRTSLNSR